MIYLIDLNDYVIRMIDTFLLIEQFSVLLLFAMINNK